GRAVARPGAGTRRCEALGSCVTLLVGAAASVLGAAGAGVGAAVGGTGEVTGDRAGADSAFAGVSLPDLPPANTATPTIAPPATMPAIPSLSKDKPGFTPAAATADPAARLASNRARPAAKSKST